MTLLKIIVLEVNLLFGYRSDVEVISLNLNINIAKSHTNLIISKYKMFQKLQISENKYFIRIKIYHILVV